MRTDLPGVVSLLRNRRRIVVFTGAGISTESGIPDFRGPDGVWTRIDPEEFTYARYLASAATRRRSWQWRFESGIFEAEPNPAHQAVTRLHRSGRMIGCVTQNIDGLHQAGGLPDDAVAELHGTAHRIRCLSCDFTSAVAPIRRRWEGGDDDPRCERCGGILKAAVISFGEAMPVGAMRRAFDWAELADAAIAIGSTLSVYPAAHVPLEVAGRGEPLVIVNRGPTEHDHAAGGRLDGNAAELVPALVEALLDEQPG